MNPRATRTHALRTTTLPTATPRRLLRAAAFAVVAGSALTTIGVARGQCVPLPVPLQQSTASFSQPCNGPWLVSHMIDLNPNSGWAIYEFPQCGVDEFTFTQSAVFETAANVTPPAPGQPLELEVSVFSGGFSGIHTHTLGLFRVSVTGDDRSTFADGLATGGDVSANWVVLPPSALVATAANSSGGSDPGTPPVLSVLGDGSVLSSGPSPNYSRCTVRAVSPIPVVTGVRLEAIDANGPSPDEALGLPTGGPGRAINGNFILWEFTVTRVCSDPVCDPDVTCDGNADQDDVMCLIDAVAGNPGCECQDPDFNLDGNVDQDDVAALINAVAGGGCP